MNFVSDHENLEFVVKDESSFSLEEIMSFLLDQYVVYFLTNT